MDYRELFKESNKEVEERFLLTRERIGEIAAGEKNGMKEQVHRYFKKTAQFLEKCASDFLCISSDVWKSCSFDYSIRIFYLRITESLLRILHLQYRN